MFTVSRRSCDRTKHQVMLWEEPQTRFIHKNLLQAALKACLHEYPEITTWASAGHHGQLSLSQHTLFTEGKFAYSDRIWMLIIINWICVAWSCHLELDGDRHSVCENHVSPSGVQQRFKNHLSNHQFRRAAAACRPAQSMTKHPDAGLRWCFTSH